MSKSERVRSRNGGPARLSATRRFGVSNTRRAAMLAIVVGALALTVAVPLRTYLAQRSDISDQLRVEHDLRQQVTKLQARKAQLSDPEQIEAEARSRLRMVMPGETPYIVQLPTGPDNGSEPGGPGQGPRQSPWYVTLWESTGGGR